MSTKKTAVIRVQALSVVITPGYHSDEVFASITLTDAIDCLKELLRSEHEGDLLNYIRKDYFDENEIIQDLKDKLANEQQRADEAVDRYENLLSEYSGA